MARRALLIGINRYQVPGADLRGCVNDVENLNAALIELYGFNKGDVITPAILPPDAPAKERYEPWGLVAAEPGRQSRSAVTGELRRSSRKARKTRDIVKAELPEVLITGCRDNQTSADAFIGGSYNGAIGRTAMAHGLEWGGEWKKVSGQAPCPGAGHDRQGVRDVLSNWRAQRSLVDDVTEDHWTGAPRAAASRKKRQKPSVVTAFADAGVRGHDRAQDKGGGDAFASVSRGVT